MSEAENLAQFIKTEALSLGFDACGIAKSRFLEEDKAYFLDWLAAGYQAEMSYMNQHIDKRFNPSLLVEEDIRSVVVVLYQYYPEVLQNENTPKISKYAYGNDYHFIIKSKLRALLSLLQKENSSIKGAVFCDSAPVLERRWAEQAGLGWIGKNANLINKDLGSFFFIGELFLNIDLPEDQPSKNYCGNCTKCLDACPTNALIAPASVDANKCISYLTIEKRGAIDKQYLPKLNGYVFGCDICQDVCPWNRKVVSKHHQELKPIEAVITYTPEQWLNMTRGEFKRLFKFSPLARAGHKKILQTIKDVYLK